MRVLDLFCGAGLVARGLLLAGFDSVTGVDLDASGAKHYPGDFVRADALRLPLDPRGFDFVWASPPCPKYSKARCMNPATFASSESAQVDLIAPVREALDEAFRAGGPHYAIENVVGAPLSVSLKLRGPMVGLPKIMRERWFETSFLCGQDAVPRCADYREAVRNGRMVVFGMSAPVTWRDHRREFGMSLTPTLAESREAMGLEPDDSPGMTKRHVGAGIPPAMARHVGEIALEAIRAERS